MRVGVSAARASGGKTAPDRPRARLKARDCSDEDFVYRFSFYNVSNAGTLIKIFTCFQTLFADFLITEVAILSYT
jgi:hypothetical protein